MADEDLERIRRSLAMFPSLPADQVRLLVDEVERSRRLLARGTLARPCEWCGRPGAVVDVTVDTCGEERHFEKPTLCDVCCGLAGLFAGGFDSADAKLRWAQEQVAAELARNWHRQQWR